MFRNFLIKIFSGKISDIKILDKMPTDILMSYLFERLIMLLRGILIFRKACFIGKGVRLKCKSRLKVGKFVTIHDYSFLDASSEKGIIIEDYCSIGKNSFIRSGNLASFDGYFIMRSGSSCNYNCFLGATGGIEIGKKVMMGPNISILTEKHNYTAVDSDMKDQGITKAPVVIEDDVWIGANSVILGGNTIGSGAIIGAGSIVTKSVEKRTIVAGNPAKTLRSRNENPSTS